MSKLTLKGLLAVLLLLTACTSTQQGTTSSKDPNPVLFTVGDRTVNEDEFLYVYNKNNFNQDSVDREEDVRNYLDLYVKFKLKVAEAYAQNLHEQEAFKQEFAGYKEQLTEPYLTDNEATDSLVQQAYDRLGQEVRASHILIKADAHSSPEDTLAAWEQIHEIREQAVNGADFGSLAQQYSEDPSARQNGGDLGYFSALQMVHQFEDAAFTTPVGEISEVLRTQFGYHILKVHDRRDSRGKVFAAHLMVRASEGMPAEDLQAAKQKIDEIYQQLLDGADWKSMVEEFSDDLRSNINEGKLPAFGAGQMPAAFEAAAFALEEPGDLSAPVQTPYGWHIIKLVEKRPLPPFEELQVSLTQQVEGDGRSAVSQERFMKRLAKENNLVRNTAYVDKVIETADLRTLIGDSTAYADLRGLTLVTIGGRPYTAETFFDYLLSRQGPGTGMDEKVYLRKVYENWERKVLTDYEKEHLADKYPEYRMLLREYREGILFFQLMDEMVWSKAVADTSGLRAYYEANSADYQWKERARATILSVADKGLLKEVEEALQKPAYDLGEKDLQLSPKGEELPGQENARLLDRLADRLRRDEQLIAIVQYQNGEAFAQAAKDYLLQAGAATEQVQVQNKSGLEGDISLHLMTRSKKILEKQFNRESSLTLQVQEGLFEKGENEILTALPWEEGRHTLSRNGRHYLVLTDELIAPAPKQLREVRGLVISDYQNHLEEEWVEALRSRYEVKINEKTLNAIINKLEK